MTENHPITPPPELVQQWWKEADKQLSPYYDYIATQAARWGADQELEACCALIGSAYVRDRVRAARRPKPPSLKEQALNDLADAYNADKIDDTTYENIRLALEALPDG